MFGLGNRKSGAMTREDAEHSGVRGVGTSRGCVRLALVTAVVEACSHAPKSGPEIHLDGARSEERDGGSPDTPWPAEDGGNESADAGIDAVSPRIPADAGACRLSFPSCDAGPCFDGAHCAAGVELSDGVQLTGQDTARGGFGDCAGNGSGLGGPSLYYFVTVPPNSQAYLAVDPDIATNRDSLLRLLPHCASLAAEDATRGFGPNGRAALCAKNGSVSPKKLVFAVSRYSGSGEHRFAIRVDLTDNCFP